MQNQPIRNQLSDIAKSVNQLQHVHSAQDTKIFAIAEIGGKQYMINEGLLINVESTGKVKGESLEINSILFYSNQDAGQFISGAPFISSAKAILEIIANERGDKLVIFKKKRRKNYQRLNTHRQNYDKVKVISITL